MLLAVATGCSRSQKQPAAGPPVPAPVAAPAVAEVVAPRPESGLIPGVSANGVVEGRVYLGGTIVRGEVGLLRYDLETDTVGQQVGMALVEPNGDFSIPYLLQAPASFLVLEARGVQYQSPASGGAGRGIEVLHGIINGLPAQAGARVAISPVTNVVYSRFRWLVKNGAMTPSAALEMAVSEVAEPDKGTGWGLKEPLVISAGDDGKLLGYARGWEETIRFDHLMAGSYYVALADDFEDGILNGVDADKKPVSVIVAGGKGRAPVSSGYFTRNFSAAYARYLLCERADVRRDDPARLEARCAQQ